MTHISIPGKHPLPCRPPRAGATIVLRSVCYNAPWVELTAVYVAPRHHGRGAGRALLEEARRRAAEAGAS